MRDDEVGISEAGRLLGLLQGLEQLPQDRRFELATSYWAGGPENSRQAALLGMSEMFRLLDAAKLKVEQSDLPEAHKELHLGALVAVERVLLGTDLGTTIGTLRSQLEQPILLLRFCASEFDRRAQEIPVPQSELDALMQSVIELESTFEESGLDEQLKAFLKIRLNEVRLALARYKMVGIEGLGQALDAAMGALVRAHVSSADGRGVAAKLGKFFDVVSKGIDLVERARKLPALLGPMAEFLAKLGSGVG